MRFSVHPPITNASGPNSVTYAELERLARSDAGAVVTKSMTHCPRTGNPEPRLRERLHNNIGSLNSMGLPNLGYHEYAQIIPKLKEYKKPVIASIASARCSHNLAPIEQYREIALTMAHAGADLLELNLSCPNLEEVPISMDPQSVRQVLKAVMKEVKIPVGVKLSPYNNTPKLFEEIAQILLDFEIAYVATINSEPLTLDIDVKTKTKVIRPNEGYGGLGGPAVLPIALAEVHRFYKFFQKHNAQISVWGVGGILKAEDAIKHFLAGASVIQIGTLYLWEGPAAFAKLWAGIQEWLHANGYTCVEELVGTVRDL
ncbi:dihydroorotate oxidase [Candidatus Acetothermia bacterium]|jgi:dihydroorotate dehydrogenase (fumarate)|nr:dihydroorotate oxidase [Candidatus Acetothermia bacterium]MCI2431470.1 dihydroorotate oxidase [Candidatus Acetothermia bacterium]MCI2436432.1 dihydroorotate oxidase [Candidatus Acetothermia bacterium]